MRDEVDGIAGPTASGARPRRRHEVLLFAALILSIALTRAPFLTMRLAGEEGEFGRSVVMAAQGHLPRGIIARSSHGREYEIPAGHNTGGYLLVGALFAPVLRGTGFSSLPQRANAAIGLRACFVALYCVALVVALALIDPSRRTRGAILLGALSLPTLPLLGSVQVNYDGAISTLIVLGTLYLFRRASRGGRIAWAALAGAFLSLGKIEFAAATATAVLLAEAFARRARPAAAFAATLVAASIAWRLIDPLNFVYGAGLVTKYWDASGGRSLLWSRAWSYALQHLPLLWPIYAAILLSIGAAFVARGRVAAAAPTALTLLFIVAGYLAIGWQGDHFPRYFAPCFPLAAVLLAELELPAVLPIGAAAALLAFALPAYARLLPNREHALGPLVHTRRDDLALAEQLEAAPRDCITVTDMDAGVGFYSSRASFACCFAQWNGWAQEQGERLCPQTPEGR